MATTTVYTGTATDLSSVLKRQYGNVSKLINNKFLAYDRLKNKKNFRFSGRDFLFPVHTGRNPGVMWYSDGGALPDAGNEQVTDASVTIKDIGGRIQLSGNAIEAGKGDAGFMAGVLNFQMKSMVDNMSAEMAIALYGFPIRSIVGGAAPTDASMNGVRAKITAFDGGTDTSTLSTPGGYSSTYAGSVGGARYLRVGDSIQWGSISGTTLTVRGGGVISSVNYSAQTIVHTTAFGADPQANDYIVRGSGVTTGRNSYGKALSGLGALVDQAADSGGQKLTFQGITVEPSDPTGWSTYKKAAAAGALDLSDWHNIVQSVAKVGNGRPTLGLADPSMIELYQALLTPDVRFAPQELKGGYKTIKFASGHDIDLVFDNYCPYGVTFFLDEQSVFWLKQREIGWDETDGKILKQVEGSDVFHAFTKGYLNLGMDSLNAHGVHYGVTITNPPL